MRFRPIQAAVLLCAAVTLLPAAAWAQGADAGGAAQAQGAEAVGPGPVPVDLWNPARAEPAEPAWGGTLVIHSEVLPKTLNHALFNSVYASNVLQELHANLIRRDWETWRFEPELCTGWEQADTLVLKDGQRLHGRVSEHDERIVLSGEETGEAHDDAGAERSFSRDQVASVERGTVFTFHLRDDVRWHDGPPFDAQDVRFSVSIAHNPEVGCDWVRPYLLKILSCEVLDAHTVRVTFGEQYFNTLSVFVDDLCILPRHLYDLHDPDHPQHDPEADDRACAREINENPHNTEWVGLGPYHLVSYGEQGIEAERFAGYWDPEHSGWVDRIVWRHIANDQAAFQALLNGELDFSMRISSEQYFGEATGQEAFTRRYCKGYFYLGSFNYTPWNMRRPLLSDLRVRKALAHAMDMRAYVENIAHGLAVLPTGPQCYFGPAYDHDVKRLEFDLDRAAELFAEAGWYDRDGDGVMDRDGKPFAIEMLVQKGNTAAEIFARMYQESLARIGARLELTSVDYATLTKRINERDFDAGGGGWSVDATENDPVQLWHSSAAAPGGSNYAGVMDPEVDRMIAEGDRMLDDEARWAKWRELHRYLYENVQPYLYRDAPPKKFALNKAIRGVQFFKVYPGYSLRRWYFPAGTPGTRATRGPK